MAIRFVFFAAIPIFTSAVALRRVVGGEYAVIHEYPHLALLTGKCKDKEQWICGASILNQKILLTAAHCLDGCRLMKGKRRHQIAAFFGGTFLSKMTIKRKASQIVSHDQWDEISGRNDIALAKVTKDIPLGSTIKRVVLTRVFPRDSKFLDAYVAGWGGISPLEEEHPDVVPDHLRKTYQKLRSEESCSRHGKMFKGMFCAGRMQKEGDYPYHGDSGSALVIRNRYHQIGLVSFGWAMYPAMTVYTNVTYFHAWITRNAQEMFCKKVTNTK